MHYTMAIPVPEPLIILLQQQALVRSERIKLTIAIREQGYIRRSSSASEPLAPNYSRDLPLGRAAHALRGRMDHLP